MLEEKAKRLIELKEEYDRVKDEYIRLRDEFHNELLNSQNRDFEFQGYRIMLVDDTIRRELDRALLQRTLKELGLSEDEIISIIISSKREIPLSGAIKIIRI
ncbi:MAG: hypothetical protein HF300_15895 [Ignavibacteria bacterium]|jgi:hypothetical protein|nr:hypothetical protein [Ignavibacteria bacterium]MCU7498845.1 hypothetical protein [Ignavibacteria bacterium]MCU7514041.1 hypothetical protein [Ignavibacteria bacterium]MCU7520790.1 hypothetical protein [Ignavibacteria bacterium]MCU7523810.1 hypothetical protein [Ignavibacteria bacterium]